MVSCLMLISPLLIMFEIFVRHASFKCVISHGLDSILLMRLLSFLSSCLHYCNSLFRSLSSLNICKLQCICLFVCLFGVLRRFQHCTGHITTGSWKGRGNQYI